MTKQTVYLIIAVFLGLNISVSVSAATQANTFIDNGNGSVTDTATGLTWQQGDDNVTSTHADAISHCQTLSLAGETDWRLPNIKELITLVDYRNTSPAIDDQFFPDAVFTFYWSASVQVSSSPGAWVVDFDTGSVVSGTTGTVGSFNVRCVR